VFRRLECRKAKEIGQGASAWRCGADGVLGEKEKGWNFSFD
jgi:hypothetical protein